MKYDIVMKSGHLFQVEMKDFFKFIEDLKSIIDQRSPNSFYADGGCMFNINDISAIHPSPNGATDQVLREFVVYLAGFGLGDNQIENIEKFLRDHLIITK